MDNTLHGYKLITYYLGIFMIMIGCIVLIPLVVIPFYQEEAKYSYCFIIPGIVSILFGYLIRYLLKNNGLGNLERHQDSLLVILLWVTAIVFSSFPWMLTGKYNFTQAIFECTSGYTTTGLSVVDVSVCPKIFLLYRSVMLFVGGIGLVLVLTCAISDRYGLRLFNAEGHPDKLLPNLKKSARVILSIYSCYIIIGIIAYCIAGMPLFDAINHSIAALSTGGFSTEKESLLAYHSVAIDIITDVLMLLGGTNFLIHLYLFKGQIKKIWCHCEIKFIVFFMLFSIPIMACMLYFNDYASFGSSLNIAAFQFISALTTTGFSNVPSIAALPSSFLFSMIILMVIGAGIGSTGGGIKQYRFVASIKGMYYNFKKNLYPHKTIFTNYITKGGERIVLSDEEVGATHNFVVLYLLILVIGTLIFTCYGYSLMESLFEFASSLGTVGVSIGVTNYFAPKGILWTSAFGMFIGRLEILVVFNALARVKLDIVKRGNK